MWFYLFLFIIVISLNVLSKKNTSSIFSIVILWIVYAFRDELGVDDKGYILAFQRIGLGWDYSIEWSFKLFTRFAYYFGFNYKFIFLIYATISFVFLYKAIVLLFENNYQKGLFIATFLGYEFIATISVMRQFTAASICLYAIVCLYKEKKTIKSITLIMVAVLFHSGAVIILPLIYIFIKKWKITYVQKLLIIFVCVTLGYLRIATLILKIVLGVLPISFRFYSASLLGRFSSAGGTISLVFLVMFVIQCLASAKAKLIFPRNELIDILEKGQLIYLGLLFLFVHAGVASRLAFTFIPFAATIPYTFLQRFEAKNREFLTMSLITVMFVLYYRTIIQTATLETSKLIPYSASIDFFN